MSAQLEGLGKTVVTVPGTVKQVTIPAVNGQPIISPANVHGFIVQALASNVGNVYVGSRSTMSRSTLVGVLVVLPIPTANLLPTFSATIQQGANALGLDHLWIDADNANDGVLVSAIVV